MPIIVTHESERTFRVSFGGKSPSKPKGKAAPSFNDLTGKAVVFRLDSQPIVGAVRKDTGSGTVDVYFTLPNSDGQVVASQESFIPVSRDSLTETSAVLLLNRDVKSFESNEAVEGVKAAVEIKNGDVIVDYQDVTFEGYGSTFKSTTPADRDGDYILPTAFDKSLRRFKENPVMLTDHTRKVSNLMGHYTKVGVNDRGLAMQGKLTNSPHPDAVHTRFQIMEGSLKTLSIGGGFFFGEDWHEVIEIDLYETSLVVIPANPDANFQVRVLDLSFSEKAYAVHMKRYGGSFRLK